MRNPNVNIPDFNSDKSGKGLTTIILSILFLIWSFSLFANELIFNSEETILKITENTYDELNFTNSLSGAKSIEVRTKKGMFNELLIPGYGGTNIIGEPKLPVMRKLIEIPLEADVEVKVVNYEVEEYNLADFGITHPLIPAQPPIPTNKNPNEVEFQYNLSAYQVDEYTEQKLVSVDILGIMRGIRIGRLNIAPIQYNPVKNKIKVFNNIEVEIQFIGTDIVKTELLKKSTYSPYFERIYHQIVNYKALDTFTSAGKDTLTKYPVKYVIISDPMFEDALQPFIQWKQKKGFYVIEGYTDDPAVGNTTTSISAYLENLYNQGTPDDPAPSFVLFVGDVDQIPAFTSGGHITDLYYCEYTGDYFPEVYYGRFSANNLAELQPQIDKTLEYEKHEMPDPSFLNEVVMIGGIEDYPYGPIYANGPINYGTTYYFNEEHGIISHTYLCPESYSNADEIIQDVSDGVAFVNYVGHGSSMGWCSPSFTTSDIDDLENQSKYPLMVGNSCTTNKFSVYACFGEALLRAENKGALGYIGASTVSYWDGNYWWIVGYGSILANQTYKGTGLGAYDRTFHDHYEPQEEWYVTQDGMIFAGNLAVTESGSMVGFYWEVYHLMGDPSLMIYYSEPPEMTAIYNPIIPIGANQFIVNTEPGAYVAISENCELHGAALADDAGMAVVSIEPFTIPVTADIVITKQNKQPFFGTVTVAPVTAPYVIYANYLIDDSAGNNNGLVDFGEDIGLSLEMYNAGSEEATDVVVTISSDDSYITITNNQENYGNIPGENSVTITNGFAFTIADDVPDDYDILFNVQAESDTYFWESNFLLNAHAPILRYDSFTIDDSQGGNGDGKVDPGETANLIINVKNNGSATANNVIGELLTDDQYITINTPTQNYGSIEGGSEMEMAYEIYASTMTPGEHLTDFEFNIISDGPQTGYATFQITVGFLPILMDEDFDTFPPDGWYTEGANGGNNWQGSDNYFTGGVPPEAMFSWYPNTTGIQGLVTLPINTVGIDILKLTFKHYLDDINGGYLLGIATTSDTINWNNVWSIQPTGDIPAETVVIHIANDDVGSENFQFCFYFYGYSGNLLRWDIDDVLLQPIEGVGTIAGTVTLNGGNGNVQDVSVSVLDITVNPDENGNYIMTLPEGTYDVTAELADYITQSVEDTEVISGDTTIVNFEMAPLVGVEDNILIEMLGLEFNCYPNPFNSLTTINFNIPERKKVIIEIFNIKGQKIRIFQIPQSEIQNPNCVVWDGKNDLGESVSSGIYFYKLKAGNNFSRTKKLLLLK